MKKELARLEAMSVYERESMLPAAPSAASTRPAVALWQARWWRGAVILPKDEQILYVK